MDTRASDEAATLRAVISTVFSTLELDEVLAGVVDIATEATGCDACLIYLVEGERLHHGLLAGLIVATLAVVAFGVYGFIVPGGKTSWRNAGTIIVEKESGTRYVFVGGKLHPTLNLASAMIINGPAARVELVSRNSLKGVPHGVPVGIQGAPQVLPAEARDAVRGPWLVCLGGGLTPGAGARFGLNLDPAAPAAELPPDRFVLVEADGEQYLLWRGSKHRITDDSIPVALGVTNAPPVPAPPAWLAMVPSGDDLDVPTVPGAGSAGGTVGGREVRVGALFTQATAGGDEQLFVLRRDGLAPVNRTMFQLLQASGGADPVALDAAEVADTPRSGDRTLTEPFADLSGARWEDGGGRALCQRQAPAPGDTFVTSLVFTAPEQAGISATGGSAVRLRPGSALVAYPVPRPKGAKPDPYLIADQGLRHHLPDQQAMASLKLNPAYQVPFPRILLESVPNGPALSRAAIVTEREG